jgi:hypothetical protein
MNAGLRTKDGPRTPGRTKNKAPRTKDVENQRTESTMRLSVALGRIAAAVFTGSGR